MTSVEVSPEGLRRSSNELSGIIERTDNLLQGFQGQLDSFGEPWGHDDLGSIIGEVYKAAHAMVMNCYNSNLETMDGYAERLGVAAENYDETDLAAADRMTGIQAGLGQALPL